MKIWTRASNMLFDHLGLKLAALVSAAVVWLFVVSQDLAERTFLIPLEIVNMPEKTAWSRRSRPPEEIVVHVRVRGQRSEQVEDADLKMILDLSGSEPGEARVMPVLARLPKGIVLLDLTPATVKILLVSKR